MERRLALVMAVAMLTMMFTLQFMDANIMFIMVLININFLEWSICRGLLLGEEGKSEADMDEARNILK